MGKRSRRRTPKPNPFGVFDLPAVSGPVQPPGYPLPSLGYQAIASITITGPTLDVDGNLSSGSITIPGEQLSLIHSLSLD